MPDQRCGVGASVAALGGGLAVRGCSEREFPPWRAAGGLTASWVLELTGRTCSIRQRPMSINTCTLEASWRSPSESSQGATQRRSTRGGSLRGWASGIATEAAAASKPAGAASCLASDESPARLAGPVGLAARSVGARRPSTGNDTDSASGSGLPGGVTVLGLFFALAYTPETEVHCEPVGALHA